MYKRKAGRSETRSEVRFIRRNTGSVTSVPCPSLRFCAIYTDSLLQRNTDTSVYGSVYSSVTNAQTCQSRLFQDYTHFSSCSLYPTKLRIPTRHPLFCSWGPTFSATWPPRLASGHSSSTRRWSTPRSAGAPSWASRCPG